MTQFKSIRERLKLTQSAMADVLGCTQGNVGHYERGQTIPPGVAKRIIESAEARGLALTFDHIYGDVELPELIGPEGSPEVQQEKAATNA